MESNIVHADPDIVGGVSASIGTRVPVVVLVENLAAGASLDEVLVDSPSLKHEQATKATQAIREATKVIEQSAAR